MNEFTQYVREVCANNPALCEAILTGYNSIINESIGSKIVAPVAMAIASLLGTANADTLTAKDCSGNACRIYDGATEIGFTNRHGDLFDAQSGDLIANGVVQNGQIVDVEDDIGMEARNCNGNACDIYDGGEKVGHTNRHGDFFDNNGTLMGNEFVIDGKISYSNGDDDKVIDITDPDVGYDPRYYSLTEELGD